MGSGFRFQFAYTVDDLETVAELVSGVVLVTGGGTGIGAAIARQLAADGYRVMISGRREEPLRAVAGELGVRLDDRRHLRSGRRRRPWSSAPSRSWAGSTALVVQRRHQPLGHGRGADAGGLGRRAARPT